MLLPEQPPVKSAQVNDKVNPSHIKGEGEVLIETLSINDTVEVEKKKKKRNKKKKDSKIWSNSPLITRRICS